MELKWYEALSWLAIMLGSLCGLAIKTVVVVLVLKLMGVIL